jgi:hypothetical protein
MRRRLPDLPWSDIESGDELRSIFAALEGSPQQLVARLRAGSASKVEQALAFDLLEGKIKPRRPRPGGSHGDRLLVAALIGLLEQLPALRKVQRKAILGLAREIVGEKSKAMGDRQPYNVLTEFDDVAISQLKKPLRQILALVTVKGEDGDEQQFVFLDEQQRQILVDARSRSVKILAQK